MRKKKGFIIIKTINETDVWLFHFNAKKNKDFIGIRRVYNENFFLFQFLFCLFEKLLKLNEKKCMKSQ